MQSFWACQVDYVCGIMEITLSSEMNADEAMLSKACENFGERWGLAQDFKMGFVDVQHRRQAISGLQDDHVPQRTQECICVRHQYHRDGHNITKAKEINLNKVENSTTVLWDAIRDSEPS